jgi:hypothetical protein
MANPSLQIGNDNWAIKEDDLLGYSKAGTRFVPEPITMTRASAGTRVNPEGLVETVGSLGSELVANRDFSQIGGEDVTNGDFSQIGTEEVEDGDFPSGTAEWNVSDGTVVFDNGATFDINSKIYQYSALVTGKTYKATYQITDNVGGMTLRFYNGGAYFNVDGSVGVHTVYFTALPGSTRFYINTQTGTSLVLKNISLKEVGQDWSLDTGWGIGDDVAVSDGTNNADILQSGSVVGKSYKATFTIPQNNAGRLSVYIGGTYVGNTGTGNTGDFTFYGKASDTTLIRFRSALDFDGTLTNISIKEVGQDWTFGTDWGVGDDKAVADNVSSNTTQILSSIDANKSYKISFNINDYSGGNFFITFGGNDNTINFNANGDYSVYINPLNRVNDIFYLRGSGFSGSITNVSVKEATINNLARVDYTDGTSSLLVEPQRTNLITYSEELYSTSNVTSSNTISPDGTLNGLKINETTSTSQHYSTSYAASVVDDGTIYTVSFYIKKGTYDLVKVYTQSSRISASIWITFSTESTSVNGSDVVSGSNFMEDAGNGWYRVGFSATASATGEVSIYLPPKDLTTYVGDVSQYTEYWGAQLEEGSYATSYIPTEGSTVTRLQDQYEKTGISNLINSEEGVLFVEMAALADDETKREITLSDGSSVNYVLIRFNSGGSNKIYTRVDVDSGGGLQYWDLDSSHTITNTNKIAIRWGASNFATFINGVKVGSQLSGSSFSADTLNELNFDNGTGGSPFNGKVKQLQVYGTALTDDELTILTGTSGVHFYPSYAAMASVLTYTIE